VPSTNAIGTNLNTVAVSTPRIAPFHAIAATFAIRPEAARVVPIVPMRPAFRGIRKSIFRLRLK
jgi:hypothetical protein